MYWPTFKLYLLRIWFLNGVISVSKIKRESGEKPGQYPLLWASYFSLKTKIVFCFYSCHCSANRNGKTKQKWCESEDLPIAKQIVAFGKKSLQWFRNHKTFKSFIYRYHYFNAGWIVLSNFKLSLATTIFIWIKWKNI